MHVVIRISVICPKALLDSERPRRSRLAETRTAKHAWRVSARSQNLGPHFECRFKLANIRVIGLFHETHQIFQMFDVRGRNSSALALSDQLDENFFVLNVHLVNVGDAVLHIPVLAFQVLDFDPALVPTLLEPFGSHFLGNIAKNLVGQ